MVAYTHAAYRQPDSSDMAGVWTNELGVEFVRFHEIVKPVG